MKRRSRIDPHGKLRKLTVKQLKDMVKGCDIVHDRARPKKEDLVELIEMCLEANEKGHAMERHTYSKAIEGKGHKVIDSEKAKKRAKKETLAKGHGWTSRYDWWFIMYSYSVGQTEYAFLWETYYDEIHRAYSKETVWYDALRDTTYFMIRYNPKAPEEHYVTAIKFKELINPTFVGKKKLKKKK